MRTQKQVDARIADGTVHNAAEVRTIRALAGKNDTTIRAHQAKWELGAKVRRASGSAEFVPGLVGEIIGYSWLLGNDSQDLTMPDWWVGRAEVTPTAGDVATKAIAKATTKKKR